MSHSFLGTAGCKPEHDVWFTEADEVLSRPAKVLTEEQRRFYFEHGYLCVEGAVGEEWLRRLWTVTNGYIDLSKTGTEQEKRKLFLLEENHSAEEPRLVRLHDPVAQHEVYQEFTHTGPVADIAEDLLGPSVRYHHSKLNFKWHSGGAQVAWHQDIQFWPHSNYSPLTIGLYLEDTDMKMGPLGVVDGSHLGNLYSLREDDESKTWSGVLSEKDIETGEGGLKDLESRVRYLPGRAGTVTIHNARMIHGSLPNTHASLARPLLLQTYSAGHALPLLNAGSNAFVAKDPLAGIVRGKDPDRILLDPRPCPMAPNFSKTGYKPTFFANQKHDFAKVHDSEQAAPGQEEEEEEEGAEGAEGAEAGAGAGAGKSRL